MGAAPVAHFKRDRLCGQRKRGACRSEGLVAGEHVPDRLGELARELDLRGVGAALWAEWALGARVALVVGGRGEGVLRGLDQPPAQIPGAMLGERSAAVALAGLADPGT